MDFEGLDQKIACEICHKEFHSERSMQCHIKIHNEKRLECSFCGERFNRTDGLFLHVIEHVFAKGNLQCVVDGCDCESLLPTLDDGEKHATNDHGNSMKCKECDDVSTTFRKLYYHYTIKHGELKAFAAEIIETQKKYLREKKRERARIVTTKKRRIQQEQNMGIGDAPVEQESESEEDEKEVETSDPTSAKSKTFEMLKNTIMEMNGNPSGMLRKISEIIGEMCPIREGDKYYHCDHCEMGFADTLLWMTHIGFHHVDDPFKCTGCSRKFENRHCFVIHLTYFAHNGADLELKNEPE